MSAVATPQSRFAFLTQALDDTAGRRDYNLVPGWDFHAMWQSWRRIGFAAAALTLAAAAPAREDATRARLSAAEAAAAKQNAVRDAALARASQATELAQKLEREREEALARLRLAESETARIADRIDALALQRREADQRLKADSEALRGALPTVERMSIFPIETLLATSASADASVRGMLVLKGVVRTLERQAENLKRDQSEVETTTRELTKQRSELLLAEAAQLREAEALGRQFAFAAEKRDAAANEATKAASRAAGAAARADTLRGILAALKAERDATPVKPHESIAAGSARSETKAPERQEPAQEPQRERLAAINEGKSRTRLQPPVVGVVVKAWGNETDSGPATGLTYRAPPRAQVIAPCGGLVAFADTFRTFGMLLILDCGGGIHVVMSGFHRLSVTQGQAVVASQPVGVMPDWEPGSTAQPSGLYLELRRDGQPVDPAPWLQVRS